MRRITLLLNIVLAALILVSCTTKNKENNKLIIFHAGSLSVPFKQMKDEFQKENPGIEILLESAGSVKCARKITDLNKDCDIINWVIFMMNDTIAQISSALGQGAISIVRMSGDEAIKIANEVICLPIYPELGQDQINYIVQSLKNFSKL